jgi:hypothetical protein
MDLFLLKNGRLSTPTINEPSNTETTTPSTNSSQPSPPVQRFIYI